MPSLGDIKRRIKSVKNTQQITKAMKMVSAAKLKKAQDEIVAARPYAEKMLEMISRLAEKSGEGEAAPEAAPVVEAAAEEAQPDSIVIEDAAREAKASGSTHPLLTGTGGPKKGVVLITSDRGLCGSFNAVMLRTVEKFLNENADATPALYLLGRRGVDHFKRRDIKQLSSKAMGNKRPDYAMTAGISKELIDLYLTGELDEVYVIYSEFKSALTQYPRIQKILPITPEPAAEDAAEAAAEAGAGEDVVDIEFLYEPSVDAVLEDLLPKYVEIQVFRALLESSASEHGARMTAMDGASRSASEMIDSLTLKYNRLRQAAITKELMEIISGAESLKS